MREDVGTIPKRFSIVFQRDLQSVGESWLRQQHRPTPHRSEHT